MYSSSKKGMIVALIGVILLVIAGVVTVKQSSYLSTLDDNYAKTSTQLSKVNKSVSELQSENKQLTDAINDIDELEWRNAQGRASLLGLVDSGKVCYLTFDDGPYKKNTQANLETLKEKNAVATWFVLGNDKHYTYLDLDMCKTIEEQGCAVGLHDWDQNDSYSYYKGSVDNYFTNDFNKVKERVEEVLGHEVKIMRFAGGSPTIGYYGPKNAKALPQAMLKKGYQFIDWNVCAMDADPRYFVNGSTPADTIVNQVLTQARYYSDRNAPICVLMHDNPGKETTVQALPRIIDGLREMGYTFKTLSYNSPGFYQVAVN